MATAAAEHDPVAGWRGDDEVLQVVSRQPRLDVGVRRELRVGLQGGQERLGPGIVGVDGFQHGPADAKDSRAVLGYQLLEWLLTGHLR